MRYYCINISCINKKIEEHIKQNYPERYKRALQYKNREDFLRSIGAYFLLEKAIGFFNEKEMQYNKAGKPYLNGYPFFNYSHSGNFIALAVDKKREVGIDIQIYGERDKNYIKNWTKKEAVLKLTGEGIKPHSTIPTKFNGKDIKVFHKRITSKYVVSIATTK